ncbi:hypothetical protein [Microvirga sp. BSC39]|uniref:hypothetical protein n=1 Tax=Microvirga sp. BSC39 TaxID=1549810 RepID=UPI0004E923A8|nr:hypothetical protein [Microvirga sp. BSC39]KFG69479.1 hypothetical protein JH26_10210 [Microvirga sp. BSC39]
MAAVFLTDEIGIALNYAECTRGEDWPVDRVILEINGSAIDEAHVLPDLDQDARTMADDILAQGLPKLSGMPAKSPNSRFSTWPVRSDTQRPFQMPRSGPPELCHCRLGLGNPRPVPTCFLIRFSGFR